jgi:hypothetical protein
MRRFLFNIKRIDTEKGKSIRFNLLYLLSLELGIHDINGIHFNFGFGVGPAEISANLHLWERW